MGKVILKISIGVLAILAIAIPSIASANYRFSANYNHLNNKCKTVTSMHDSWNWGGDDYSNRRPGAISCLADKKDKGILEKMNKLIRGKYKIRDRRRALADTVALLNLTSQKPGVKCKNGKAGLECRYTDNRGRKRVHKFPAITADYANIYLDKNVTTALEAKYNVNSPQSKTPEERIAELEKTVRDLTSANNMCGCSGSGSSYAKSGGGYNSSSTSAGVFVTNGTTRNTASVSGPAPVTSKGNGKKGSKSPAHFYKVKGSQ